MKTLVLKIKVTPATPFQQKVIKGIMEAIKNAIVQHVSNAHKANKVEASFNEE